MFTPTRIALIAGIAIVVVALLWVVFSANSGCGSDDQAKDKAAKLAADIQAAAQQNKIPIVKLADLTRAMNAASDGFTSSKDRGAYCKALSDIRATNGL